jgi:hypothetical protein
VNEGQQYTRGDQVLTPSDVSYLFRAIEGDLQRSESRLRSLATHFRESNPKLSDEIEIAVSNTMSARSYTRTAARKADTQIFPHRKEAGEHEHW